MAFTVTWDSDFNTNPTDDDQARDLDTMILQTRQGSQERLGAEHYFTVGGTQSRHGMHTKGSAVAYTQASAPTVRPDGSTLLDATDNGRLWTDTSTVPATLKQYVHPNWETVNGSIGWSSGTTYGEGDIAHYSNALYYSRTDANTGNAPPVSTNANANWVRSLKYRYPGPEGLYGIPAALSYTTLDRYATAGSYTWTKPAGINYVFAVVIAGGGGGGGLDNNGGTGENSGSDGGDSYMSNSGYVVRAIGGTGGTRYTGSSGGNLGVGGTGGVGLVGIPGQDGGQRLQDGGSITSLQYISNGYGGSAGFWKLHSPKCIAINTGTSYGGYATVGLYVGQISTYGSDVAALISGIVGRGGHLVPLAASGGSDGSAPGGGGQGGFESYGSTEWAIAGGGGGGEMRIGFLDVSAYATLTVAVGAGGAGGNDDIDGGAGAAGEVRIYY